MKRLIVDLPEEQRAALERLAHERRTTVSALILEAIDDRLRQFVTDEATPPSHEQRERADAEKRRQRRSRLGRQQRTVEGGRLGLRSEPETVVEQTHKRVVALGDRVALPEASRSGERDTPARLVQLVERDPALGRVERATRLVEFEPRLGQLVQQLDALDAQPSQLALRPRVVGAVERRAAPQRVGATDQLSRLHFTRVRTTRDRLMRLYDLRVLDRFRPTLPPGNGTAPFHWVLDEVGARIVAADQGISRDDLPWRHTTALGLASSATLDHRVAVNEFFVRLADEARATGGALHEWYGERTTRRLLDGIAIPDGYGVITLPDRDPLHLLLELDRGTEPLSRIRDKVDRYAKALPRSELADANPLVLFLTLSEPRKDGIAGVLATSRASAFQHVVAAWLPTRHGRFMDSILLAPASDRSA